MKKWYNIEQGVMADFVLDESWSYRFGADFVHDWGIQPNTSPIEQVSGVYGFTPLPGLIKTGNPHALSRTDNRSKDCWC